MNRSDLDRNAYMLFGSLAKRGYLRWWHSFTGHSTVSGRSRTFFVEYLILNPLRGCFKRSADKQQSYVQITAGVFPSEGEKGLQFVSRYPVRAAKYAKHPLYFQVDENIMSENRISGFLNIPPQEAESVDYYTNSGSIEWDIEINKTLACHTGIIGSPLMSALNALDSFWHGEGIRSQMRGFVTIDDETYEISPEESFGYADKHWGRSYNNPWLQLASCDLISQRTGKPLKNSALAIDGCCPRFLFFRLKPCLMMQLTYTGEDFCFSFARPLNPSRMKWATKEQSRHIGWHIKGQSAKAYFKLTLTSAKKDLMKLSYDDPGATAREHIERKPLWAGANASGTIDLYRMTPKGREWLDSLTIRNAFCEFQKPSGDSRK